MRAVVAAAGDRLKVAGDILNFDEFFLPDDKIPYDEKSFEKHIRKGEERGIIEEDSKTVWRLRNRSTCRPWKRLMHDFVAREQIKIGPNHSPGARSGHGQIYRAGDVRYAGNPGQIRPVWQELTVTLGARL